MPEPAHTTHDINLAEPALVRQPVFDDAPNQAIPILYRHQKRSDWGRAVCLGNRAGRRAFQFEDGKLRLIASAYAHLLERIRLPTDEAVSIARDLHSAAGISMARRAQRDAGKAPLIDLTQQAALFRDDYPEGFADPTWLKTVRGLEGARHKKRQRDLVIAKARESLSVSELDALVAAMSGAEIIERIRDVLAKTDLVNKRDLAGLEQVSVTHAVAVGSTLRAVLEGEGSLDGRMQRYIAALSRAVGSSPRWELVSALPALIDPTTHVYVRPAAVREQIKSVARELQVPTQPSGAVYLRVCRMVETVARRLEGEGLKPQDRLDVADFMWATLRPAAKKRFTELLALRRNEAPDGGGDQAADAA